MDLTRWDCVAPTSCARSGSPLSPSPWQRSPSPKPSTSGPLHPVGTIGLYVRTFWGYAIWSFAQQLLLQSFFLARFRRLLPTPCPGRPRRGRHLRPRAPAQPHPDPRHHRLGTHRLPLIPALPQSLPVGDRARHPGNHAGHHHPRSGHPQHARRTRLRHLSAPPFRPPAAPDAILCVPFAYLCVAFAFVRSIAAIAPRPYPRRHA